MRDSHESYGKISISRFSCNKAEFFGSDIFHNGGISISISKAYVDRKYHKEWFGSGQEIIRVRVSANQYVDAITSGMNTVGVPCTIERLNNSGVEQIPHVIDKKEQFTNEMVDTQQEYRDKIDDIISKLDGNIGKRKAAGIKHDLEVLRSHISSNTDFVLKSFNEAMENTVTEAKQSVANYIENKIHTLGIEAMKNELNISIEKE